jgi:hypothetical protein
MGYFRNHLRTEHAGHKGSGRKSGYFGARFYAKALSSKVRRERDRQAVDEQLADVGPDR